MEEERINELEENIKSWREELDTVWKGKETEAIRMRDELNTAIEQEK